MSASFGGGDGSAVRRDEPAAAFAGGSARGRCGDRARCAEHRECRGSGSRGSRRPVRRARRRDGSTRSTRASRWPSYRIRSTSSIRIGAIPAPLSASFEYLIEQRAAENIVFIAHLGDVVENALAMEFAQADPVFRILDRARFPYSVLAGNHDIDASKDDTRGASPYLRHVPAGAVPADGDVRRLDGERVQLVPRVPGGRTAVVAAGNGLAAVGRELRVGARRHRQAPAAAGHPHHARAGERRPRQPGRVLHRPRQPGLGPAGRRTTTRSSSPSTATSGRPAGWSGRTPPATTCTCT